VTALQASPATSEAKPSHVVMQAFTGPGGRRFARGTKVAALDFLNLANLEKRGFLARLPGTELDPHASKARAHAIRKRHWAFAAALSQAEAELKHQAEGKRQAARARLERALAEDLGAIAAELETAIAAERERLRKEAGLS